MSDEAPAFPLIVEWRDAPLLYTRDEKFSLRLGFLVQDDVLFAAFDSDIRNNFGDIQDGTAFRRLRVSFTGNLITPDINYKLEIDLAQGLNFIDVFLRFHFLPELALTVGQFQEPFTMAGVTTNGYEMFVENAPIATTLGPDRNKGAQLHLQVADEQFNVFAGFFRPVNNLGANVPANNAFAPFNEDLYAVDLRAAFATKGETVFHVGLDMSYRDFDTAGPLVVLAPVNPSILGGPGHVFAAASPLPTQFAKGFLFAGELALSVGPVTVQAEFITAAMRVSGQADRYMPWGAYLQVGFFLTGEHRPYDYDSATFGRVRPLADISEGPGAMEVALRFAHADLREPNILVPAGRSVSDLTLALNWFLNANIRAGVNYVYSLPHGAGDAHFFVLRVQVQI